MIRRAQRRDRRKPIFRVRNLRPPLEYKVGALDMAVSSSGQPRREAELRCRRVFPAVTRFRCAEADGKLGHLAEGE